MQKVKLGDICTKQSSAYVQKDLNDLEGEYPIYGASGFIKKINIYHQDKDYVAVVKDGAGIGRTMYLPAKSSVIGTLQYLIPKEGIEPKYLYYAVKSSHLEKYYTGATIPHIYFKDYQNEPIILYGKDEQIHVVSVLEKVEKIIEIRKQELKQLEELIKSRFIEMFGDPVTNSKGLVTKKGSDFFTLKRWKICARRKKTRRRDTRLWGKSGFRGILTKYLSHMTLIVVGRVGFQSGNVHFATGPLWVTDNAMYISDINKDQYDLRFLCALMERIDFTRFQVCRRPQKNHTKTLHANEFLLLHSIQQQKSFIAFVEQTDKSKLIIQKSLDELETLNKALMQKYFGGN